MEVTYVYISVITRACENLSVELIHTCYCIIVNIFEK